MSPTRAIHPLRAPAAALFRQRQRLCAPRRAFCADPAHADAPVASAQQHPPDPVVALPLALRADARRLDQAIAAARDALATLAADDKDDEARVDARAHARAAILAYRALAARAAPAPAPRERAADDAQAVEDAQAGSDQASEPGDVSHAGDAAGTDTDAADAAAATDTASGGAEEQGNAVVAAFGADIQQIKDSVHRANAPRIWIGWTGYF